MRHPYALAMVVCLAVCAASATAQPLPPPMTAIALDVRVDHDAERIDGSATLTVRNADADPLTAVPLLLNRLMRVRAVHGADGRPLAFAQRVTAFEDETRLQVTAVDVDLGHALAAGEEVGLRVEYGGHLAPYTETGMLYVRDHVAREFTILREDAYAFPTPGLPSARANRAAPRQPFDFTLAVTVAEDLVVANGGEPVAVDRADGQSTWRYRSREPAPFLIAAIAPFERTEREGVRVFHLPDDDAGVVLDAAARAADRFDAMFGPLQRPLAVTIIQIPDGWGSQASLAGGIIQESAAFRDRGQLHQLYHELSHLWNAPDLDAPSPRWNEGLATFLQGRLARELDGWDGEAAALERTAARLLQQCGDGQPCGTVPLRQYGRERLTDHAYGVGRLMFATLHHALGEDAFDRALRAHFQQHQASGTRSDHLIAAFVAIGGGPAQRIFADWFDSTAWLERLRETGTVAALFEHYR